MIGVVDYGMGNLRSLCNALDRVGLDAEIAHDAGRLKDFERLILPGVGAFGRAMQNIRERDLERGLRAHANAGKPLLGICLGMQLFATSSLEFGEYTGLDLIPGQVVPLVPSDTFPVPHVGWNTMDIVRPHSLFRRTKTVVDYYFVHSFHFRVAVPDDEAARTQYGVPFTSVVARNNVVGCQFHPEKSQAGGLALLERFGEWDGKP